jgi:hypothetical protein
MTKSPFTPMTAQAEFHRRMHRLRQAQWRHQDRMRRKYGTAAANSGNPGNHRNPRRSRHAPIYVHLALVIVLFAALLWVLASPG